MFFSFIKGNNLSAILIAAFWPLSSPSKQIIGLEKNFQIKEICLSVKNANVIKFLLMCDDIDIYNSNFLKLLIDSGIKYEAAFIINEIVNRFIKRLILNWIPKGFLEDILQ